MIFIGKKSNQYFTAQRLVGLVANASGGGSWFGCECFRGWKLVWLQMLQGVGPLIDEYSLEGVFI